MRKEIWKKGLIVIIMFLFVGTSIVPRIGNMTIEKDTISAINLGGNILYVGGSGEGNYTKIQDAIDDANNGDTIFVYSNSSPYHEHIIINKSISLIGENKNTTIIDGESGIVIKIIKDQVKVKGFTVTNGTYGFWIFSSNNIIMENNIWNNIDGIWLRSSKNNEIRWNVIHNSKYDGIVLYSHSNNNIIEGNIIQNSGYDGIILHSSSSNNIVRGNIAQNNSYYGIVLDSAYNNTIMENSVRSNGYYGIILNSSNNNVISHNNFITNRKHAFFMKWNVKPSHNLWDRNYWDDWLMSIPRPIFGRMKEVPWINFDWHPASEPHLYAK
ncbi:MAG TPA: hypothetical protein ENI33_09140 [Thermoplasmatales archaeon]|nr:hypothetical protein [Thermoplasmatales archaeon]